MNWNLSEEYQDSCGQVLVIVQEIQETTIKGPVKYRESYYPLNIPNIIGKYWVNT